LIATGRELAGFAITETVAGSNPRAITTTATPDSKGWRLNGQKSWIGHGSWAGTINVFAQMLDANHQPIGISGFVVRQGTLGLKQGPEALTMGMRGMVQNSIYFKDVLVTSSNLLGEQGNGMKVAQDAMMFGRLGLGVMSLGAMKRCAQLMLRYSKRRMISTGKLLDNPVTLVRLNNLTAAVTALETLVFKIADLLDQKCYIPQEVYTACKTSGPEFFWSAADQLVQLLGGRGYIETNIAPQMLRDARLIRIFEGPTETLNMFLGSCAINKVEELQQFLSESLGMPQVAQRLKIAIEKINQHITNCQSSSYNQDKLVSWVYFRTGELTTFAILLATVEKAFEDNDSEDLRHALNWVESNFEQKLKSIISGTILQSVIENTDTIIAQIPDADTIIARISSYAKTIGDLEQTLPGEDHELDNLLRLQTPKINSGKDTVVEFKNNKDTVKFNEKINDRSLEVKNLSNDASINNSINKNNSQADKELIISKLNSVIIQCISFALKIEPNKISSESSFFSLGIDSLKAIEIVGELQDRLNIPISPQLIFDYKKIIELSIYVAENYAIKLENKVLIIQDKVIPSELLSNIEPEISLDKELHSISQDKRIIGEL